MKALNLVLGIQLSVLIDVTGQVRAEGSHSSWTPQTVTTVSHAVKESYTA